jgi:hypothetical protein
MDDKEDKRAARFAVITVLIVLMLLQIAINHITKVSADQIERYNIQYVGL